MASQIQQDVTSESTNQLSDGHGLPRLSGGGKVLGHLREFMTDPVAMLRRGCAECGDLFEFRLGPSTFVLFGSPEAHAVFFKAPEDVLDPKSVYQFTVPIFGRGVAYDVSSEIMTEQLGFLFPALRESSMKRFARIMFDESNQFANRMGDEGELELPVAMNELTVNIASHCFIGEEVRNAVDAGFAKTYHELQGGINTIGFFLPRVPIPSHRTRDRARREITRLFGSIMAERRRHGRRHEDFMDTLMYARYKDGRALTDSEVIGLLITTLFAGQHTSAVLATWTGLELIRDTEYQSRVLAELEATYRDEPVLSFEGLRQQRAMEHAVRECERLHPPLIVLIRKVLQDLSYRGHTVKAGTLAMVSPGASHRLPQVFSEPDRFKPDRFCPPDLEDQQHPDTLIGFGGGKHRCMGKNFAIMQIKALWTVLLDRFEFERVGEFPASNYGSWVTGPVEPCMVRYRRRQRSSVFH